METQGSHEQTNGRRTGGVGRRSAFSIAAQLSGLARFTPNFDLNFRARMPFSMLISTGVTDHPV